MYCHIFIPCLFISPVSFGLGLGFDCMIFPHGSLNWSFFFYLFLCFNQTVLKFSNPSCYFQSDIKLMKVNFFISDIVIFHSRFHFASFCTFLSHLRFPISSKEYYTTFSWCFFENTSPASPRVSFLVPSSHPSRVMESQGYGLDYQDLYSIRVYCCTFSFWGWFCVCLL